MNLSSVAKLLSTDDGSLPDINLDFCDECIVADAYALIQNKALRLVSTSASYWSKDLQKDIPISFGDNPAVNFLQGDADPFHVVFGGLLSSSGVAIPDLGVFVLDFGYISLDYRMGPTWSEGAVEGLFELIRDMSLLGTKLVVSHENNIYDQDGLFVRVYNCWLANKSLSKRA